MCGLFVPFLHFLDIGRILVATMMHRMTGSLLKDIKYEFRPDVFTPVTLLLAELEPHSLKNQLVIKVS
jgi:hypothetical protein